MPSKEFAPDGSLRPVPNKRDRSSSWNRKRDRIIRENNYCFICGDVVDKDLPGNDPMGPSIDHLIPVAKGGTDDPENLYLAHLLCNKSRGTKDIDAVRFTPQSRVW